MAPPVKIRVVTLWDPLVRLTHWGLATIIILNAVLTQGGSLVHVWAGWIGLVLLGLRMAWGLVGSPEARFAAFPPRPLRAIAHLQDLARGQVRDTRSHNPAGAMMAYALWLLLAVVIGTGLVMVNGATPMRVAANAAALETADWGDLVNTATPRQDDGDEAEPPWEFDLDSIHETAANLMLILAILHVGGVLLEQRALRRNLIGPMLTGRLPGPWR
jgi:cytochrome b